jgi:hypothetical protein
MMDINNTDRYPLTNMFGNFNLSIIPTPTAPTPAPSPSLSPTPTSTPKPTSPTPIPIPSQNQTSSASSTTTSSNSQTVTNQGNEKTSYTPIAPTPNYQGSTSNYGDRQQPKAVTSEDSSAGFPTTLVAARYLGSNYGKCLRMLRAVLQQP